jgi:glucosamine--fructose-6-phosphate aminotransferase (isomerizing)
MDLEQLKKKFPNGELRQGHPYYMADAISDIPDCLDACLQPEYLNSIHRAVGSFIPQRIFLIGCGTSLNAGLGASYTLQNLLHIPVTVSDSYDFEEDMPPAVDDRAMLIAISESGQSITTCLSLESARRDGAFTVAISANPESRLAKSAHLALIDPFRHELPLGKTRSYLSTSLLAMLAGLAFHPSVNIDEIISQFNVLIPQLKEYLPYWFTTSAEIAGQFTGGRKSYMVTGFGAQKANSDEIRLKLLEVLGESATSFGLEEFTHGPSASFHEGMTVILMQTDPRTLAKAVRVSEGVVFSKADLIVITDQVDAGWPARAKLIKVPAIQNQFQLGQFPTAMAAQTLVYSLAIHKGLNPDVNLEDIHPELGDIYAFFFPPGTH